MLKLPELSRVENLTEEHKRARRVRNSWAGGFALSFTVLLSTMPEVAHDNGVMTVVGVVAAGSGLLTLSMAADAADHSRSIRNRLDRATDNLEQTQAQLLVQPQLDLEV